MPSVLVPNHIPCCHTIQELSKKCLPCLKDLFDGASCVNRIVHRKYKTTSYGSNIHSSFCNCSKDFGVLYSTFPPIVEVACELSLVIMFNVSCRAEIKSCPWALAEVFMMEVISSDHFPKLGLEHSRTFPYLFIMTGIELAAIVFSLYGVLCNN